MTKDDEYVKYLKRSCDFRIQNHKIDEQFKNND